MRDRLTGLARLALAALALICASATASVAQPAGEFYRGKQITLILDIEPGGAYDSWARLITPFMTKYLPGNPPIIFKYMPGAGGIVAANNLYLHAARDGLTIGMIGRNLPQQALMKVPNVLYEPAKFNWIGSPEKGNTVAVFRRGGPAQTVTDLFERQTLMGGAGAGTAVSVMPVVLSRLLGMRFKLIEGYGSPTNVYLAMERGEADGVFVTLTSVQLARAADLESGNFKILFNMERSPVPELGVPSIFEFARTDEQRRLLGLLAVSSEVGRPIIAPPGVPPDRVAVLRAAFDAAMRDPELKETARRGGLSITTGVSGAELEQVIQDLMSTPPALVETMNTLMH